MRTPRVSENEIQGIAVEDAVLDAARALAKPGRRTLLGIVGAPASGKSTLAEMLVARLAGLAESVPMDGFHLSQAELERLGRAARKGAPDTFDAHGYGALLHRIHDTFAGDETVYAPGFYRRIEEPIAAAIPVSPDTALVITEGNYLLLDDAPWPDVAQQIDEIWYLHVDTSIREQWLTDRHIRFGRSPAEARDWIAATDRPNAERIEATATRCDRYLIWDGARIRFGTLDAR